MQNLLIIEDDLIQSHNLANSICRDISNVRLYGIIPTGAEAKNILREEVVDIIILDLKLPDMTGIELIEFISRNNLEKYENSVIIYTGDMSLLSKAIKNKYIYNYCSKSMGIEYIIRHIKNLVGKKETNYTPFFLDTGIRLELEKLNFDFSYNGTKYLYDCIHETYLSDHKYDINLDKEIYPILSKKYHKTKNSIKTNIFHAISMMYYDVEESVLSNYFGYDVISKPKTKELISTIMIHIQRNLN